MPFELPFQLLLPTFLLTDAPVFLPYSAFMPSTWACCSSASCRAWPKPRQFSLCWKLDPASTLFTVMPAPVHHSPLLPLTPHRAAFFTTKMSGKQENDSDEGPSVQKVSSAGPGRQNKADDTGERRCCHWTCSGAIEKEYFNIHRGSSFFVMTRGTTDGSVGSYASFFCRKRIVFLKICSRSNISSNSRAEGMVKTVQAVANQTICVPTVNNPSSCILYGFATYFTV